MKFPIFTSRLALTAATLAMFWACAPTPGTPGETVKEAPPADSIPAVGEAIPAVQPEENDVSEEQPLDDQAAAGEYFIDTAARAGIEFLHYNGSTGEYFLPEITGSGGALFDYDHDGDLDLYLVQGATLLAGQKAPSLPGNGPGPPRDRLYRNDTVRGSPSGLRFTDVTTPSGIKATGFGMGVAVGDYNNDGFLDLYVTNVGPNQLWRNNGDGTFRDVTQSSRADDSRWSTSATFVDYDRDGWLDLFIANYVEFSAGMERRCFAKTGARDYCGPDTYTAVSDRLLHNRRDGTFEDVSVRSGITSAFGAGLGVIATDFNGDGWTDLYVANDGDPNQLWINRGGTGKFEDESLLAGVALNPEGRAEAGMGVDAGDFDGDGDDDIFLTHLDGESNRLYVNRGDGFFEDQTIRAGLQSPSMPYTGFGTGFFDYDNDGRLDLLVLNGAVRIQERQARQGETYPLQQPNQLFRNTGKLSFEDVSRRAGAAFALEEVSRGAAFGDVDNDGDTDVVVFNNSGRARILLNQLGNRNRWLGIRAVATKGGLDVVQARVEVLASSVGGRAGGSIWRRAHRDGSYCSALDARVLVGLESDATPRTVRIHWPGGPVEEWKELAVDRYWELVKGSGRRVND